MRELRQHLEHKAEYEFNDLGTIRLNAEGKYEFTPCEAGILTPELYGLNAIEMEKLPQVGLIQTMKAERNLIADIEDEIGISVKAEELQDSSLNFFLEQEDEEPYTIRPSFVRNLLAACIAALAFLLFPANIGNEGSQSVLISKIDTGMLTHIISPETDPRPTVIRKVATKRNVIKPNIVPSQDFKKLPLQAFYTIVLCSRVSLKNATSYRNTLHQKGYQEVEVFQSGRGVKVIHGRYETENQAYNILNRLHSLPEFKDCWVMRVKG